ncbi:magnesium chelatase subunit D [Roseibium hamelinense]|uniref:Magnesium chelatase subunit D n=1 Tax=Roseibium hamelinense TaxID=150831 RepID=A0A562SYH8_9HYPH|nr:VWA domain-containing protein [Roseibium hamelinense]MTI44833.1 VWA domain-containing protein [Roseibium hamelinense]TWI85974.1 magnesium chelatase subunit D [Roseibium hamelinense]
MPDTVGNIAAGQQKWQDALLAARLLTHFPDAGVSARVRGSPSPAREKWLVYLKSSIPNERPLVRIPSNCTPENLRSDIDVVASLVAGRITRRVGSLERANRGYILVSMAERLEAASASLLAQAAEGTLQQDTQKGGGAIRSVIVAFDEAGDEQPQLPAVLSERLVLDVCVDGLDLKTIETMDTGRGNRTNQPVDWQQVTLSDKQQQQISDLAVLLGSGSLRVQIGLSKIARMVAALDGRNDATDSHLAHAARLVFKDIAIPEVAEAPTEDAATPDQQSDSQSSQQEADQNTDKFPETLSDLEDLLVNVQAANASITGALNSDKKSRALRNAKTGKSGNRTLKSSRGRPVGLTAKAPFSGVRPNISATLRAAIPWQRLRNPVALQMGWTADLGLRISPTDFRFVRFKHRSETTAIFAVDASGSTALSRLAEAKGAVELLLADCYVRRDSVALVAFRGTSADTLLEPTRSLVRAKRSLAALPGGGATPLASGIMRSLELAEHAKQRGQTPLIVYLTDGRGNISLAGNVDRKSASEEAVQLARQGAALGIRSIFIDIAARPKPLALDLAKAMEAEYCALPHVTASAVSQIVSRHLAEKT